MPDRQPSLTKACNSCKEELPVAKFYRRKKTGYLAQPCITCAALKHKEYRQRDAYRNVAKNGALKSKYGISLDQYKEMLEAQNGVCAICGNSDPFGRQLAVDHDHKSGKVRGLLCTPCNQAVGLFADSAKRFLSAANYLEDRDA